MKNLTEAKKLGIERNLINEEFNGSKKIRN
jgi:hypothetical protein